MTALAHEATVLAWGGLDSAAPATEWVVVLAFVFLEQPTGVTILVIAALLLVALAVIEFLAGPGDSPPPEPVAAPEAAGAEAAVPDARRG